MSNPIQALKARAMANTAPPAATAPVSEPSAAKWGAPATVDQPWPANWPAPAPCPTCGSPGYWVDVYGGGPHCRGCNAPPSPSLVGFRVWAVGEPGADTAAWERTSQAKSREAAPPDDGWLGWSLPSGVRVVALFDRIDQTRVHSPGGRYSPPLACGPVGDMSFDEWFDWLPDLPGSPTEPNTVKGPR